MPRRTPQASPVPAHERRAAGGNSGAGGGACSGDPDGPVRAASAAGPGGGAPAAGPGGPVMERLTRLLAGVLRAAARWLPPGRREWAEAVRAEADQVPAGWPRLGWLAGGLWLAVREAEMMRKVVYWLGVGMVAATAAWAVRLSWQASSAAHPLVVTDRVRVLVGVAALAGLPWAGRRRGWFGPVGGGPHGATPFSLPREIIAAVLLGVALASLRVVRAIWPRLDASTLWALAG